MTVFQRPERARAHVARGPRSSFGSCRNFQLRGYERGKLFCAARFGKILASAGRLFLAALRLKLRTGQLIALQGLSAGVEVSLAF